MSKFTHSNSLRRRCFAKSNLHQLDSCNIPADQASSTQKTPDCDYTINPVTIAVEDTNNNSHKPLSPKPKRKHASNTLSSPQHNITPQLFPTLSHSTSGSSIDSGVGLSRASSLSSLPCGSKRPSRESSSTNHTDIASPLLESQGSLSTNRSAAKRANSIDVPIIRSRCACPPSDSGIIGEPTGILNSQNVGILSADDIEDLTQRTHRLSISRGAVENLQTAVERLLDDLEHHPQTEPIHKQGYLDADFKSSDQDENDGPYLPKRRHSSAGPYIPLTQRQTRPVERKRSAQPFFHRSKEDSSSTPRRRKTSACIVCERKHRVPTMSAESVFLKTARFPDRHKRRRYSEVLKVCQ